MVEEQKQQFHFNLISKHITSMENGVYMLYSVDLTNPLITQKIHQGLKIKFGLSGSVSVDFTTQDGSDFYL